MKLKLSQERGIAILEVYEEVSLENVSVMRAGITKLLASGKNKIIVNLVDAQKLSMDVITEIVKLHMTATELKGQIVVVGQGDLVKQAVKSFSVPPPIKYFSSREAALRSLADDTPKKTDAAEDLGGNAELKQLIANLEFENKALKAKLAGRNPEEMKKIRLENGQLKAQVGAMEEQLRILTLERKKPFEIESLNAKLQQLETALEGFLEKENLVSKS